MLVAMIPETANRGARLARPASCIAQRLHSTFDEKYYTYAVRSNVFPDRYAVYALPGRALGLAAEFRHD